MKTKSPLQSWFIAIIGFAACTTSAVADEITSNLSSVTGGTETSSGIRWLTGSFSSGASAHTLNSVTLKLANTVPGTAQVMIYSGPNLEPQTLIGTLVSPAVYPGTLGNATFTTPGMALVANTTYWIVFRPISGTFEWAWAASDSGTGAGFLNTWGVSTDAGAFWWTQDIYSTQFAVTVDCPATTVTGNPQDVTTCPTGGASFTVAASGASLGYGWQAQLDGSTWTTITDGTLSHNSITLGSVSGATTSTISFSNLGTFANDRSSLNLRALVQGACESTAVSATAVLTVCRADFNCDAVTDFFDYLDFVSDFSSGSMAADFNRDSVLDFFDYLDFVSAFSTGC